MSPFEVDHVYKLRKPLLMSPHGRIFESTEAFAQHVQDLHNETSKEIQTSNAHYKLQADLHRRHTAFNIGDYVMVQIRPKRFPPRSVRKLQARSAGPFKVLQRVGPNAYVIDIPPDYGISSTFNV